MSFAGWSGVFRASMLSTEEDLKKLLKTLFVISSIILLLFVQFFVSPQIRFQIYKMLGGLAIFIYGMTRMTNSLGLLAGDKIKKIFERFTTNPLMGMFSGIVITSMIQSSSATTVMVVGFVNSGMMTLNQAIGVIIGANIGTTVTGQLIAFKISQYAYLIIALGLLLILIAKSKKNQSIGQCMLGFGLLFVGMEVMEKVVEPLKNSDYTLNMIRHYSDSRIFGVFVGTLFTIILQSSSATVGITMTIAGSGLIDFPMAVALILGDNIGTTITAVLAASAANRNAKRAAFAHSLFNILGVIVILLIFPHYLTFVQWMSPTGARIERLVANSHSYFNIINAFIFIFLVKFLAIICYLIFPKSDLEKEIEMNTLDKRLLNVPSLALSNIHREINRMARMILKSLDSLSVQSANFDYKVYKSILEQEDIIDNLCEDINHYLVLIEEKKLTKSESREVILALHLATELEKIADQIEILAEIQRDTHENKIKFSTEALEEINALAGLLEQLFRDTILAVKTSRPDVDELRMIYDRSYEVLDLERRYHQEHVNRLAQGKCDQKNGIIFLRLLENYQKAAINCRNVAGYLTEFYEVDRTIRAHATGDR